MRVSPCFTSNHAPTIIEAALSGLGLACTFAPLVDGHLKAGALETCLEPFCVGWSGYHIYYPDRRQKSAALGALIDALRQHRKR